MNLHAMTRSADSLVVFDFETTGLSPDMGDRSIEVGAVLIESGRITQRFQQLMNPGVRIPLFVENLTGITTAMAQAAPSNAKVMAEFYEFIAGHNLVAHNASFDDRFLRAEFRRIKKTFGGAIACSLLAARRLLPTAPNHQLITLADYLGLPNEGNYHRALADAEVTAHLWLNLLDKVRVNYGVDNVSFEFMQALTKVPKHKLAHFVDTWRSASVVAVN